MPRKELPIMTIWLVMQATDGRERTFAVRKATTVIGRETTCDVRVPVPTVSQRHCQITLDGSELRLVDLQSERGTYLNGLRVQQARLAHQDTLTIGPVTFIVRMEPETAVIDGQPPEIIIERQMDIDGQSRRDESAADDRRLDLSAG